MSLVDIGVNLTSNQFHDDLAKVLDRSRDAGVGTLIATGTTVANSGAALHLECPDGITLVATAGVHPHHASEWTDESERIIAELLLDARVVASGECGLDYNRMVSPKDAQLLCFEAQLALSTEAGKPVFLHCRDAFEDFRAVLAAHSGPRGVVHCFTDSLAEAQVYLDLGFDIGITGWLTDGKRGQALRDAVRALPLERLHLETDAPYLTPANMADRPRRNEPAFLPYVAQMVAQLKGCAIEEVIEVTAANSRRMFGL